MKKGSGFPIGRENWGKARTVVLGSLKCPLANGGPLLVQGGTSWGFPEAMNGPNRVMMMVVVVMMVVALVKKCPFNMNLACSKKTQDLDAACLEQHGAHEGLGRRLSPSLTISVQNAWHMYEH